MSYVAQHASSNPVVDGPAKLLELRVECNDTYLEPMVMPSPATYDVAPTSTRSGKAEPRPVRSTFAQLLSLMNF